MIKKLKLGIWTICQNPDCNNTSNPDQVFLVSYESRNRNRQFCSLKCAAKIRSNTPEFKKAAGEKLRQANRVRHILYPEWDKNNKNAVSKSSSNRVMTQENRDLSGRIRAEANRNRKELYPEWDKNQRAAVSNMFQDSEFLTAHKLRWQETLKNLHSNPEFIARRNKRASETYLKLWKDPEFVSECKKRSSEIFIRLHQDPEFCRKQREAASKVGHEFMTNYNQSKEGAESRRKNFLRKMQNGDIGRAQKILFDRLPELNPLLSDYLYMEKIIYLTDDIKSRYPGSNKSHYRVDIAYTIDDQVNLAIEVDGAMGHSSDEDLQRDKVRDNILLIEFGILTLRVKNEEVFRNSDEVSKRVMLMINKLPH